MNEEIKNLENQRKKILLEKFLIMLIFVAFFSFILFLADMQFSIFLFIFLGYFLSKILTRKKYNNFLNDYKKILINKKISELYGTINYYPNYGIKEDEIKNLNVIISPDIYSSSDLISGTYNNVQIECANVKLIRKYRGRKARTGFYYDTFFCGQWYIFDLNSNENVDMQILSTRVTLALRPNFYGKNYKYVEILDDEYNNLFNSYTRVGTNSSIIFTPQMIECLKILEKSICGTLIIVMKNNKLYVAINNNRNFFVPNLFEKIDIEKVNNNVINELNDMNVLINFVMYLKTMDSFK